MFLYRQIFAISGHPAVRTGTFLLSGNLISCFPNYSKLPSSVWVCNFCRRVPRAKIRHVPGLPVQVAGCLTGYLIFLRLSELLSAQWLLTNCDRVFSGSKYNNVILVQYELRTKTLLCSWMKNRETTITYISRDQSPDTALHMSIILHETCIFVVCVRRWPTVKFVWGPIPKDEGNIAAIMIHGILLRHKAQAERSWPADLKLSKKVTSDERCLSAFKISLDSPLVGGPLYSARNLLVDCSACDFREQNSHSAP